MGIPVLSSSTEEKSKYNKRSCCLRMYIDVGRGWCMPLVSALGRQKQADLYVFKVSLVYRKKVPGQAPHLHREALSRKTKLKKKKKKEYELIKALFPYPF